MHKSSVKKEIYSCKHILKEGSQINNLILYLKELEKEELTKAKLAEERENID